MVEVLVLRDRLEQCGLDARFDRGRYFVDSFGRLFEMSAGRAKEKRHKKSSHGVRIALAVRSCRYFITDFKQAS